MKVLKIIILNSLTSYLTFFINYKDNEKVFEETETS